MLVNCPSSALAAALRLHYQPIIRLADGALCHVEVLARIARLNDELCGPQGIVEAMADIEDARILTRAIMERAFAEYQISGLAARDLPLAFNLPLNLLLHPTTPERIEALRQRHGVPAGRLKFELTESQPVEDPHAAAHGITALENAGYQLALDDIIPSTPFLELLMQTPVSAVKLDRSVVKNSGSSEALAFIRHICRTATMRRQSVVAEGIETPAQRREMASLGATHGQGFLFCRPLVAQDLAGWLNSLAAGLQAEAPLRIPQA